MQQSEHPASQIVHPSASTATTPAPTAPTGFSLGPAPTTTPTPTPAATPAASTFSFGPAPTPAPAVATRSFSFGPTPTPAPATATPAPRGFSFGPAPTPAAAAATSFSFGRPAPTPAPAAASTASFNFGPAPTAAPAIAPPPQRGFSFGPAPTPAATHWVRDPVTNTNDEFHCITAHPDYSMASLEELRWQAYAMKPCLGLASTTEQSEEPVVSLQNAMQALLVDPTFADVTFEVDGEEVRAHRSILSARSPTFKAMFTSGLSESAEGAVIKLDCNKRIFEDVLKYIYTGQVAFSDVDTAIEMLGRAEEYFLPGLKKECENVLVNQYLTEDTATSLIVVADMYRTPALKKACVDFILRNTQSVNVTELDKAMLAELLVAACSITPHRPAFPTPVPRTTGPFSAWGGGRSTTTLAAAPTPPAFG